MTVLLADCYNFNGEQNLRRISNSVKYISALVVNVTANHPHMHLLALMAFCKRVPERFLVRAALEQLPGVRHKWQRKEQPQIGGLVLLVVLALEGGTAVVAYSLVQR